MRIEETFIFFFIVCVLRFVLLFTKARAVIEKSHQFQWYLSGTWKIEKTLTAALNLMSVKNIPFRSVTLVIFPWQRVWIFQSSSKKNTQNNRNSHSSNMTVIWFEKWPNEISASTLHKQSKLLQGIKKKAWPRWKRMIYAKNKTFVSKLRG